MGSRIARRLLKGGYPVTVFDRRADKANALLAYGATVARSIAELASETDAILSCLANDEAVRNVYMEPQGVLAHIRPGSVIIEMSTVSPETSRELWRLGSARGISVLDVPVSGSTPAAEQGTLTLLCGGDADLFKAAEPIFQALAAHYFLLGPSGSGTTMKLVVNAILGIGMQAIAEAVALGETAGLDRKRLFEVLSQTAVVAPAHAGKLAQAEEDDYRPQFSAELMNKDFGLILEVANSLNLPLPATDAAFDVNTDALREYPHADFSCVVRHMEKIAEERLPQKLHSLSTRANR